MKGGQVTGCERKKPFLRSIMERLENGTAGKEQISRSRGGHKAFIRDKKRTNL
jgi:hypothetical protein